MSEADAAGSGWADACLAARLFARDPVGLGGMTLRCPPGPVRDAWLACLRAALPSGAPMLRLPLHAADDRLLGGLDLAATLRAGRPVAERGLLAQADGGIVLLAMAERLTAGTAARIAAALDTGEVAAERDGFAIRDPARIGVVALDEGIAPDERPSATLTDRCAFLIDLAAVSPREAAAGAPELGAAASPVDVSAVDAPDDILQALCGAAAAFGVASLRATLMTLRAARAAAALAGRRIVSADDAALAARLVLAPRATRLPAAPESEPDRDPERGPEPGAPDRQPDPDPDRTASAEPQEVDDMVLEAVQAALPPGLLAALTEGGRAPSRRPGPGGSGLYRKSRLRGRPAGTVRGEPSRGARLNVVETLRAAAPWQAIRREAGAGTRLAIRRDDLRITRFKAKAEATTIFVVDASGSAAFHRLAEAKGAVELLLADCYARRDRVALIAFRGATAEILLPPTRSLTRAKRGLAALPGGGGTPLAAAIDAAATLAVSIARGDGTPLTVFLTDGRANVARDGSHGRERAQEDARASARVLRAAGLSTLFVDTSPRPQEPAQRLAAEMGARYLPLPSADAATLSSVVRREMGEPGPVAAR